MGGAHGEGPSLKTVKRLSFLIVGAQKAGTSALYQYLYEHNQLFLPATKELHFFDDESLNWNKAVKKWSWSGYPYSIYHKAFAKASQEKLWGEATPIYMYWQPCMKRIWQYNPNMKLIVVLRNPITRAYSQWNMEHKRGNETLQFLDAIKSETSRAREALPDQHRIYSYLARGIYSEQLRRIWQYFRPNQTLIIKHENLLNNAEETLDAVHGFLEVEKKSLDQEIRAHTIPYEDKIHADAKTFLKSYYQVEILQLEQMLNWNCRDWME